MYESLVVISTLIFMYLLIGWIHIVILFILRTYKNQNFSEFIYVLIWPKLYVILCKLIIQEIEEGKKK